MGELAYSLATIDLEFNRQHSKNGVITDKLKFVIDEYRQLYINAETSDDYFRHESLKVFFKSGRWKARSLLNLKKK